MEMIIGIIILVLLVAIIILLFSTRKNKSNSNEGSNEIKALQIDLMKELRESENRQKDIINDNNDKIREFLEKNARDNIEERARNQHALSQGLQDNQKMISDSLLKIQESTEMRLANNAKSLNETITLGMQNINDLTTKKLNEIQGNVNEKLDKSLNERLDENFKQVGERLEELYKSLGEIKNLESGVVSLNKTLSNVKSRGVYGEIQLGNILANVLDKSQYDVNVKTKPKSNDLVEYAIKIPDKEDKGGFIYLPIDAKFPTDIYVKIVEASEKANPDELQAAQKELKTRITTEAKTIRDKYVSPPDTTDFAIMFLPTEGLYAEVLRIPGLAEECQEKYKIVISGPMNLTAMVNSLSIGFKYLTVNKKTEEITKTLGNFKTQFGKFTTLISETQTSLDKAMKKTEKLSDRNRLIQKSLSKIEVLDDSDCDVDLIGDSIEDFE